VRPGRDVAKVLGGIEAFPGARPDDGFLELGLVTAKDPAAWARALGRVMQGRAGESPFIKVTQGKRFRVRFDRPFPYELDGGARTTITKLRIKVHPGAITICVPTEVAALPPHPG
jgi:diacylglycerol kinase (ATP)